MENCGLKHLARSEFAGKVFLNSNVRPSCRFSISINSSFVIPSSVFSKDK